MTLVIYWHSLAYIVEWYPTIDIDRRLRSSLQIDKFNIYKATLDGGKNIIQINLTWQPFHYAWHANITSNRQQHCTMHHVALSLFHNLASRPLSSFSRICNKRLGFSNTSILQIMVLTCSVGYTLFSKYFNFGCFSFQMFTIRLSWFWYYVSILNLTLFHRAYWIHFQATSLKSIFKKHFHQKHDFYE